jgi:GntR family transcriptional regulator
VRLRIQPGHHPPIYQQITEQLRRRIASESLVAGQRLPSVRALAEQLVVNPNTVARAYRELEREHYVVSRPGDGVFVADRTSPFFEKDRRKLLIAAVDRLLSEAEQLGADPREVVALIEEREATGSSRAS